MTVTSFEIRVCVSCGLRYPLTEGHSFGKRCPQCLGETRVISKHRINEQTRHKDVKKKINGQKKFAVLLDNIRSAWNVGSILRSADGFGFDRVYLCGITPTPELESVRKTSLDAEAYLKWSYHKDAVELVKGLKEEGWSIIALEDDERSLPVSQIDKLTNIALILGNEVTGVDPELLNLADKIAHIPMRGQKRSFNVANAFSIAAYTLTQQGK